MEYDLEKWVLRTWLTEHRYYIGEVKQNIFGQWLCRQEWGSRLTRFWRSRDLPAATYDDALAYWRQRPNAVLHEGIVERNEQESL